MTNSRTVNVVAALTTGVALFCLHLFLHASPPGVDRRVHEELGRVMAGEALKAMQPGARLIVISRDREPFHVPAAEAQLESFVKAVEKTGKKVSTLRALKIDPLRVVGVPPGDFFDLLRQGRDDDVIVSFLGPPVLRDEQLKKLGEKWPRVLAVCSGAMPSQVDLKKIFDQKLLLAAVVNRPDASSRLAAGKGGPSFGQMFKLITPANVSELPEVIVARE